MFDKSKRPAQFWESRSIDSVHGLFLTFLGGETPSLDLYPKDGIPDYHVPFVLVKKICLLCCKITNKNLPVLDCCVVHYKKLYQRFDL